jgi:hypothetical protein
MMHNQDWFVHHRRQSYPHHDKVINGKPGVINDFTLTIQQKLSSSPLPRGKARMGVRELGKNSLFYGQHVLAELAVLVNLAVNLAGPVDNGGVVSAP